MKIICSICCLFMIGCAGYKPIVDTKGVNNDQYEIDLKECQQYAEQVSPGTSAAAGAGIGAGLGALVGLAVGIAFNVDDKAGLMAFGAGIGGLRGAAEGGAAGMVKQKDVICNCLRARGYDVLE